MIFLSALILLSVTGCGTDKIEENLFVTEVSLMHNDYEAQETDIGSIAPVNLEENEISVESFCMADEFTDTILFTYKFDKELFEILLKDKIKVSVYYGVSNRVTTSGELISGGKVWEPELNKGGIISLYFKGKNIAQNNGKIYQSILCIGQKIASEMQTFKVSCGNISRYEAEDAQLIGCKKVPEGANGSSGGYVDYMTAGNSVIFNVWASNDCFAKSTLRLGLLNETFFNALSEVYRIEINGEEFICLSCVPQGLGPNWLIWSEIRVGNIPLCKGKNKIELIGVAPLLLDYIDLQANLSTDLT